MFRDFPETGLALADLYSEQPRSFGGNRNIQTASGHMGINIGENRFDPEKHSLSDINPLSPMSQITGDQYVDLLIKRRPLNISIITEHSSTTADDGTQGLEKFIAGQQLKSAIEESMPNSGDTVNVYHIGREIPGADMRHTDVIDTESTPVENAEIIVELCTDSLAFVISSFSRSRLRFEETNVVAENTVALRTLHSRDVAIPLNGVTRLGNGREAASPREAIMYNKNTLDPYNKHVDESIKGTGMHLGRIIVGNYDTNGYLFDPSITDVTIAEAIRSLDYKA